MAEDSWNTRDPDRVVLVHIEDTRWRNRAELPIGRDQVRQFNLVSFEPDEIQVFLDNKRLALEPGQSVMPHGIDRGLDPDEILERGSGPARP